VRENSVYRGADKSLARPGRKHATATEDFDQGTFLLFQTDAHNYKIIEILKQLKFR